MGNDVVLRIEGLRTYFKVREGTVKSVDGVDLSVGAGETVCLVGESGCGKSVTARSIMQLVDPPGQIVDGSIWFRPRPPDPKAPREGSGLRTLWRRDDASSAAPGEGMIDLAALSPSSPVLRGVRGRDVSMVFQEPMASLSPVHRIGQQLDELLMLHERLDETTAKARSLEALEQVGLPNPERIHRSYAFELSGGMRQRAMIAMAIVCRPRLLVADEPTTALDVTTQRQIIDVLRRMQSDLGMAMLFITHDLGLVAQIADRVAVMYLGTVVEECDVDQLFYDPRHPYTRALLESMPRLDPDRDRRERLRTIRGSVPHPLSRPAGCPFLSRCDHAHEACEDVVPRMIASVEGDRSVRCTFFPDSETVSKGVDLDLGPRPVAPLRHGSPVREAGP